MLYLASENGNEDVVDRLLLAGADVHAKDKVCCIIQARSSFLRVASEQGHDSIVKRLLEAGADVYACQRVWFVSLRCLTVVSTPLHVMLS